MEVHLGRYKEKIGVQKKITSLFVSLNGLCTSIPTMYKLRRMYCLGIGHYQYCMFETLSRHNSAEEIISKSSLLSDLICDSTEKDWCYGSQENNRSGNLSRNTAQLGTMVPSVNCLAFSANEEAVAHNSIFTVYASAFCSG